MKRNLIISFLIIVSSFLMASCHHRAKENQDKVYTPATKDIYSDIDTDNEEPEQYIPINLTLTHPEAIPVEEYEMRYKSERTQDSLIINPTSYNYDGFNSGKRYQVKNQVFLDPYEWVENVCFDAIITNNTDQPISINKLVMDVEDSHVDPAPYFYIYSIETIANSLIIIDDGWTDYGGFTLEYSLLKKGEEFNGKYAHSRKYKRLIDYVKIDFTEDMIQMGYKWDYLKEIFGDFGNSFVITSINYPEEPAELFHPFEWSAIEYAGGGLGDLIYLGFCRLYGKLTFEKGHAPVEFSANIQLSSPDGLGGALFGSEDFDFELSPDKVNYEVIKPYNTTLQPKSTEKISLKIGCPKSSYHKFRIRAIADTDIDIHSSPISLHYMMPRHFYDDYSDSSKWSDYSD